MITFISFFQILSTASCGIWNVYAGGDMSKIAASVSHTYVFIGRLHATWQSIALSVNRPVSVGSTALLWGLILNVLVSKGAAKAGSPTRLLILTHAWLNMIQHGSAQSAQVIQPLPNWWCQTVSWLGGGNKAGTQQADWPTVGNYF